MNIKAFVKGVGFFSVALFVFFLIPSNHAYAGSCSTTSSGSLTSATWTGTCGGGSGAPTTGDNATISSGDTITLAADTPALGTLTINGTLNTSNSSWSVNTTNLTIATTGTLTAHNSFITLNGTSGTLFTLTGSGVFTAGGSTVEVDSNASVTLTSGVITFFDLNLTPPSITGNRVYTFGSGAVTISDNFTINPLSLSNTLTVNLAHDLTVAGTTTIQGGNLGNLDTTSSNYALTTGILDIESGGKLTANNSTVTLSASTASPFIFNASASIDLGTSTFIYSGDADETLISLQASSQVVPYYDLVLSPTITASRVYSFDSRALAVRHNFTINPSSAGAFNLKVNLGDTTSTVTGTTLLESTGLSTSATLDTTISNVTFSTGILSISGTFNANSSIINITGTSGTLFTVNGGTFSQVHSSVNFTGNGDAILVSGTPTFYNLTSSGTGIKSLGEALTVSNTLTVSNGTLTTTGSNYAVNAASLSIGASGILSANGSTITISGTSGSLFTNSGTFSQGTSLVIYNADTDITIPTANITYSTVEFLPALTATRTYTLGGAIAATSLIDVKPSSVSPFTLNVNMGGALTGSPLLKLEHSSANASVVFDTTSLNNYAVSATIQALVGSTLNLNNSTVSAGSITLTGGTINAGGSIITIVTTLTSNHSNSIFNAQTSTINIGGISGPLFDFSSGTFTAGTSTVNFNGNGSTTLAAGLPTFYNLTSSGTGTKSLGEALTVSNNLTISAGTLDVSASNYAVNVGGNWSNSATFNGRAGTVTLNTATTATVTGPTTFYNLTITHTSAKEVDFSTTGSHIIAVTHTFSATGSAGNLIKLYSTSAGSQWHFLPTGTATVDYVDVKDGGCEASAVQVTETNFTYSGNNGSCWDSAAPTVPGTPSTTSPTTNTTPSFTWTASTDSGSGLAATPYTIQYSTDNTFASSTTATSATNSYATPALAVGTWYIRVKATDLVGNVSAYSGTGSVVINVARHGGGGGVAVTKPVGPLSFTINAGAGTTPIPNVLISISQSLVPTVVSMALSSDPNFTNVGIMPYTPTTTFVLPSLGMNTLYLKLYTPEGVSSDVATASINYTIVPVQQNTIPQTPITPITPAPLPAPAPVTPPSNGNIVYYKFAEIINRNDMYDYIKNIQRVLNYDLNLHLSLNGLIDTDTKQAVFAFQRKHNLDVDGIIGKNMRAVLETIGIPAK